MIKMDDDKNRIKITKMEDQNNSHVLKIKLTQIGCGTALGNLVPPFYDEIKLWRLYCWYHRGLFEKFVKIIVKTKSS